jgi:CRP-like cAMP-binding protein
MSTVTVEMLTSIPVFQSLGAEVYRQLVSNAEIIPCQPGEILYSFGDRLTGLYTLVSGYVKLYRGTDERVQILALLRHGDCFGTEALTNLTESSYSAAALTSAEVLFLPAETMRQLMVVYPQVRVLILQLTTERLRQFAALVHSLAFRDVTARLARVLVVRAEQDGIMTLDGIRVHRLMTQSELATMVGTGREVVQRTFKKLQQQGIIEVSRKEILIRDMDKLRVIADEESR